MKKIIYITATLAFIGCSNSTSPESSAAAPEGCKEFVFIALLGEGPQGENPEVLTPYETMAECQSAQAASTYEQATCRDYIDKRNCQ